MNKHIITLFYSVFASIYIYIYNFLQVHISLKNILKKLNILVTHA